MLAKLYGRHTLLVAPVDGCKEGDIAIELLLTFPENRFKARFMLMLEGGCRYVYANVVYMNRTFW